MSRLRRPFIVLADSSPAASGRGILRNHNNAYNRAVNGSLTKSISHAIVAIGKHQTLTKEAEMHSSVIVGNAVQAIASSAKGWVVGHFMPPGAAWSCDFEIKIWHYDKQPDYLPKIFGGTEFIIVEAGTLKLELEIPDGRGGFEPLRQQVELNGSARDYIILPPGCKKRVLVVEAPSYGITVRWPSVPGMNVVV